MLGYHALSKHSDPHDKPPMAKHAMTRTVVQPTQPGGRSEVAFRLARPEGLPDSSSGSRAYGSSASPPRACPVQFNVAIGTTEHQEKAEE